VSAADSAIKKTSFGHVSVCEAQEANLVSSCCYATQTHVRSHAIDGNAYPGRVSGLPAF